MTLAFLKEKNMISAKDAATLQTMLGDPEVSAATNKRRSSSAAEGSKRPVVSWTPANVNKLRPNVPGCWMQRYGASRRWQVYYQGAQPSYSRSRTWGDKVSEKEVIVHCLKWAWHWHTAVTGAECPWDLAS